VARWVADAAGLLPETFSASCGRSRGHAETQPKRHVAAKAKRDDIAAQQVSKADHVYSTGPAHFVDPGIGVMELSAAVGADESASPAERFLALHTTGGRHGPIVGFELANVDPVSG
jgi:hypothetical protein